jgi:RNA polymerase sigma factor (sigma-70 family)
VEERTDIELVKLARHGDKDAFGVLTQRYQMTAQRFAMRLVGKEDSAQELAQEAMVQAYLSLDRLRDPARFKSWLCGIVLNVCRSHLRDREIGFFSLESMMRGVQLYAVPLYDVTPTPEKIAEERELYQTVLNAVNALSPGDRDILLLFYYAQLNLQEIATVQGVTLGAVKVRLHRARQRLKDKLLSQHPEIIPREKRRKKMIKVTIADMLKVEHKEEQVESLVTHYIIVLYDEAGRRLLSIWVGPFEGQAIAAGLIDFAMPRPMTYDFFSNLLQAVNARVEEVHIVALKKDTFYAVVKMRSGQKTSEIDARPSDAIALAVLNDVPIFVADDVLETAGVAVPETVKGKPTRQGLVRRTREMEEAKRQYQVRLDEILKEYHERTQEEVTEYNKALITSIFSK